MKKIKISAVSYLNTTPFIYGIENDKQLFEQIELSKDIPAECARKLQEEEVDLGLIPVAAIPFLKKPHIISDFCIGAIGKVKSVLLLSDVPLKDVKKIYLDYQSRTSVALCKLLCKEHWNISPEFIDARLGYEQLIKNNAAGVIIGDRTFHLTKQYTYQYDLSEEWRKMTSLPFVFAAWVSNKKLPNQFIKSFNIALNSGLEQMEVAINSLHKNSISKSQLLEYLTKYISFELDEDKKKGLDLFLKKLTSSRNS